MSFCEEDNCTFMWDHYAKNECCLVFDKAELGKSFSKVSTISEPNITIIDDIFLQCIYLPETDAPKAIEEHFNGLMQQFELNGNILNRPYNYSSPNVFKERATYDNINCNPENIMAIDIMTNFVNFIKSALILKFSGTQCEYEKEKEVRVVFYAPPDITEQTSGNKKYIEIRQDRDLFFKSIVGVKICPNAKNKDALLKELTELNNQLMVDNIVKTPIDIIQ